jgi:hypothetical protein
MPHQYPDDVDYITAIKALHKQINLNYFFLGCHITQSFRNGERCPSISWWPKASIEMGKRTPGRENALRKIISCGKIER